MQVNWLIILSIIILISFSQGAPCWIVDGKIKLRMLADRLSLEIFANDGRIYLPMTNAFDPAVRGVSVSADGSGTGLSASSHTLTPIWPRVINR